MQFTFWHQKGNTLDPANYQKAYPDRPFSSFSLSNAASMCKHCRPHTFAIRYTRLETSTQRDRNQSSLRDQARHTNRWTVLPFEMIVGGSHVSDDEDGTFWTTLTLTRTTAVPCHLSTMMQHRHSHIHGISTFYERNPCNLERSSNWYVLLCWVCTGSRKTKREKGGDRVGFAAPKN